MKTGDKKAAIAAYKERKAEAGIYAVRCRATGESWVGRTQDLAKAQNGLWFTLRLGTSPNRAMQQAFTAHGDSFAFDILERLEEIEQDYLRAAALKERTAFWRESLGAPAV